MVLHAQFTARILSLLLGDKKETRNVLKLKEMDISILIYSTGDTVTYENLRNITKEDLCTNMPNM